MHYAAYIQPHSYLDHLYPDVRTREIEAQQQNNGQYRHRLLC